MNNSKTAAETVDITSVDLASLRAGLAVVRREWNALKCDYWNRKAGFRPEQPRVPAGSPGRGQWTDDVAESGTDNDLAAEVIAGKRSAAFCWNQMQIDMLLCSTVQPASRRAACRAQANERYGACLAGRQLPTLNY